MIALALELSGKSLLQLLRSQQSEDEVERLCSEQCEISESLARVSGSSSTQWLNRKV